MTSTNLQNLFRDICQIVGVDPEALPNKAQSHEETFAIQMYSVAAKRYCSVLTKDMIAEPVKLKYHHINCLQMAYTKRVKIDKEFRVDSESVINTLRENGWKIN